MDLWRAVIIGGAVRAVPPWGENAGSGAGGGGYPLKYPKNKKAQFVSLITIDIINTSVIMVMMRTTNTAFCGADMAADYCEPNEKEKRE